MNSGYGYNPEALRVLEDALCKNLSEVGALIVSKWEKLDEALLAWNTVQKDEIVSELVLSLKSFYANYYDNTNTLIKNLETIENRILFETSGGSVANPYTPSMPDCTAFNNTVVYSDAQKFNIDSKIGVGVLPENNIQSAYESLFSETNTLLKTSMSSLKYLSNSFINQTLSNEVNSYIGLMGSTIDKQYESFIALFTQILKAIGESYDGENSAIAQEIQAVSPTQN